jgi:hypothetical protein
MDLVALSIVRFSQRLGRGPALEGWGEGVDKEGLGGLQWPSFCWTSLPIYTGD